MDNTTPKTKTCTKCKKPFPATSEYFHVNKKGKHGVCSQCKKCKAAYWLNSKKHHCELSRKYYQANKSKIADRHRAYRKETRVSRRIQTSRRRARENSLPDTFTTQEWLGCLKYFNHCCAVCGSQLRDLFGDTVPHADHWIPLASEECTGTIATNMVCLCNHCNLSKGATMPKEWLSRHYSKREAKQVLERIEDYFSLLERL